MPRRYRPRPRRVIVPVLLLAVLAAAVVVLEAAESPSWLGWLPPWSSAAIAAALAVFVAWWFEPWATRRTEQSAREQKAVDRLRAHLGRQETLARVRDVDPLALRVHQAIPLPDTAATPIAVRPGAAPPAVRRQHRWSLRRRPAPGDRAGLERVLPTWVDREKAEEVRGWLREATETGGFLLLVGDSSVGKTRLLYEAVREVLPDWAMLTPDLGDGDLVNTVADATFALPRLVVWLDEIQRFLPGPYLNQTPNGTAVTTAALRRLLDAPTPVIVVGSLWPEHARELRSVDTDPGTGQQHPRHLGAADILDDRRRHELTLKKFSAAERKAAEARAAQDPRLAEALAVRDYTVTEVLAGAPQLIRRYEQASPDQKAVLQAAIDARRLGIQASLTPALLSAAARGYLTTIHADDTWFEPTITELIREDRSTAPLIPIPDRDHRSVIGYALADYLLQHGQRQRGSARVPPTTWQALIKHTHDPQDVARLGESAENRLLYCYAIPLYRRATNADAGDGNAAYRLAGLLAEQGNVEELRARADAGDGVAAYRLAGLLAEQGNVEDAIAILRARADAGDPVAPHRLAGLLAEQGMVEELRARADAGDRYAALRLPGLLVERGDVEDAIAILRARADAGDGNAAYRLADLLAERGMVEELRARADAGDEDAAYRLADLLAERGMVEELRARADAGDGDAAERLAGLLAEQGNVEDAIAILRARADAGDENAAYELAGLLAERGMVEELRARADAGDRYAAERLADLLVERGDVEDAIAILRARADAGDGNAALRLADLLAELGMVEELRARADAGDGDAAERLAGLLAEQGNVEELRARADAGDRYVAYRLADLLTAQGRSEEASNLRRFGVNPDGGIARGPAAIDD